jgi:hypothetical protein
MKTHIDNTQEHQNHSTSSGGNPLGGGSEYIAQFIDNRPQTMVQAKLQGIANKRLNTQKASALQSLANNKTATIQKQVHQNAEIGQKVNVIGEKTLQLVGENEFPSQKKSVQFFSNSTITPIQRQKVAVTRNCNLRTIGNETEKTKIPTGAIVDIKRPVESLQFKFSRGLRKTKVVEGQGPWHTKVKYQGHSYWIKNSHLGHSEKSEIVLPNLPEEVLPADEYIPPVRPDSSSEEDYGKLKKTAPMAIGSTLSSLPATEQHLEQTPPLSNPLDNLGSYFKPRVAPVKEKNRTKIGGNVGYDQIYEDDYNPNKWVINPIDGFLCNQEGMKITGQNAWVLSGEGVLYGSQSSDDYPQHSRKGFQMQDMDSHEKADASNAIWAGEMRVAGGKVVAINNQSGTYHFESEANVNILTYLLNNGIITQDDIDHRTLMIMSWTQTDIDRIGNFSAWEGFQIDPEAGKDLDEPEAVSAPRGRAMLPIKKGLTARKRPPRTSSFSMEGEGDFGGSFESFEDDLFFG